jgi:transglutaminase-like putative cysteine protease
VQWRCEPEQDSEQELTDDFGNRILELHHARIQRELIWAVELKTQSGPGGVLRNEGVPATGIGAFLLPSALCDANPEIERAVAHLRETQQIGPKALKKARRVFVRGRIAFLSTRLAQRTRAPRFRKRWPVAKGVCQDYAHVMIALCRSARIPGALCFGLLAGRRRHARLGRSARWRPVAGVRSHTQSSPRADYVYRRLWPRLRDVSLCTALVSWHAHSAATNQECRQSRHATAV